MRDVIISIKPQYVKNIIAKNKRFEYRKKIFKQQVNRVYVYASYPTKKIVGYFYFSGFLEDSPENIWKKTKDLSGINKHDFFAYFEGRNLGYAINIEHFVVFDNFIDPKEKIDNFCPPQSYMYLDGEIE